MPAKARPKRAMELGSGTALASASWKMAKLILPFCEELVAFDPKEEIGLSLTLLAP